METRMKIGGVRLFVDSIDTVLPFYRALLGEPMAQDAAAGFVVFDAAGVNIVVERVDTDADPEDRALVGRFTGVSFEVDDIALAHAQLSAAGVLFSAEPELQAWGGWLASLQDPAGNQLQLVQYG
jgi:predicted enzyme related to lactoylglutathione lyase